MATLHVFRGGKKDTPPPASADPADLARVLGKVRTLYGLSRKHVLAIELLIDRILYSLNTGGKRYR